MKSLSIVVATVPLTGHVHPMLLVVKALVDRGHRVAWYGASKFAAQIEATGARFVKPTLGPDLDDATLDEHPALRGKRGLSRVKAQLIELFIKPMNAQLADLEVIEADLVLADQAHLGAALLAEKRGMQWAGLGVSTMVFPSVDTAPFGSARPPAKNVGVRKLGRFLTWLINRVLFRQVNRAWWAGRVQAGLPAGDEKTYFEQLSPDMFLQPTIPELEYPRSDLPAQVRFIGPLVPSSTAAKLPTWWGDVEAARAVNRPVVLVTQGTLATNPRELLVPALRALADEDVLVIATSPSGLGIDIPPNARVAPYVPYQALLPYLSVMVTNGGYGGVQMAIAHGVPLIVAGGSEEKPEVAARVAWSGAGLDLRTGRPSKRKLLKAVKRVLGEPQFRARAQELAAVCARHDAVAEAVRAVEALADQRAAAEAA